MRWQKPAETLRFRRKAVIELRTIALATPHGGEELERIASEIEADADHLERRANAPQQRGDKTGSSAALRASLATRSRPISRSF
jgi:hypothetical protein